MLFGNPKINMKKLIEIQSKQGEARIYPTNDKRKTKVKVYKRTNLHKTR